MRILPKASSARKAKPARMRREKANKTLAQLASHERFQLTLTGTHGDAQAQWNVVIDTHAEAGNEFNLSAATHSCMLLDAIRDAMRRAQGSK